MRTEFPVPGIEVVVESPEPLAAVDRERIERFLQMRKQALDDIAAGRFGTHAARCAVHRGGEAAKAPSARRSVAEERPAPSPGLSTEASGASRDDAGGLTALLTENDLARSRSRFSARLKAGGGRGKIFEFYPDEGPLRRELYPKHLQFFRNGAQHRERLMMAANRIGKTEGIGGYETALHLTGLYPDWWEGRRFAKPVQAWAAGRTAVTTRDIVQAKLCGPPSRKGKRKFVAGTGLLPAKLIEHVTWAPGIADHIDTLTVRHVTGGPSVLRFKSYEQGRGAFEGTEQDVIWLDEEPPFDVYNECIVRTMTTDGLVYITFTPLNGMSEVVRAFLEARPELEVTEDE